MIEAGQKASFENDDEEECFGGRRRRGRHLSWLRGALFGKRLQTNDEGQRRGVRVSLSDRRSQRYFLQLLAIKNQAKFIIAFTMIEGQHMHEIRCCSTRISGQTGTKLRDGVVWQAMASCYSWAALSSNDSNNIRHL